MKSKLNILCICPIFVPIADSEALCSAKIILSLLEEGVDITAFTLDRTMLSGEWPVDRSNLWDPLSKLSIGIGSPEKKELLKSVKTAIKYHTHNWARWVNNTVIEASRIHERKPFDVVYSRSLPMYSHIAGYWCSRALNIPWIANINDPWDYHLFPDIQRKTSLIYNKVSIYWLKKTLKKASLITYPCVRLGKFHNRLSGVERNSIILPHIGYKSNDHQQNDALNIVHAGKLGSTELLGRPTNALIEGMACLFRNIPEAKKITKLILVGPKDDVTEKLVSLNKLNENVDSVGRTSYVDSLDYISKAAVCVLVEGNMKEGIYLPSKIADYLVAKKPVLALSPAAGTINDMLPEKGIIRVDQGDVQGVANTLAEYYKRYRTGSLHEKTPSDEIINQFMPNNIVKKYMSAVDEVMKNGTIGPQCTL